jgi:hypothetical protein
MAEINFVSEFERIWGQMINDLYVVFPKVGSIKTHVNNLTKFNYEKRMIGFVKRMAPFTQFIKDQDDSLFKIKGLVIFGGDIPIQDLWKQMDDNQKKIIWWYMISLNLIGKEYLHRNDIKEDVGEEQDIYELLNTLTQGIDQQEGNIDNMEEGNMEEGMKAGLQSLMGMLGNIQPDQNQGIRNATSDQIKEESEEAMESLLEGENDTIQDLIKEATKEFSKMDFSQGLDIGKMFSMCKTMSEKIENTVDIDSLDKEQIEKSSKNILSKLVALSNNPPTER